jgi:MOSC domain-containing protein YiiM
MASLLSVNVGLPRDIAWQGRTVHTAIWKEPIRGQRLVRRLNIDGDGQGDLAEQGGEHRAVLSAGARHDWLRLRNPNSTPQKTAHPQLLTAWVSG